MLYTQMVQNDLWACVMGLAEHFRKSFATRALREALEQWCQSAAGRLCSLRWANVARRRGILPCCEMCTGICGPFSFLSVFNRPSLSSCPSPSSQWRPIGPCCGSELWTLLCMPQTMLAYCLACPEDVQKGSSLLVSRDNPFLAQTARLRKACCCARPVWQWHCFGWCPPAYHLQLLCYFPMTMDCRKSCESSK